MEQQIEGHLQDFRHCLASHLLTGKDATRQAVQLRSNDLDDIAVMARGLHFHKASDVVGGRGHRHSRKESDARC